MSDAKRVDYHRYAAFRAMMRAETAKRDADPIRAARSAAFIAANREPGCTPERAIDAANAAEVVERVRLGITDPMDCSKPAAEWPWFPSDVRSMDHFHLNE